MLLLLKNQIAMKSKRNRLIQQLAFGSLTAAASLVFSIFAISLCSADEVQINQNSIEAVAGDFRCKPCYRPNISDADTIDMGSKSLTTGDLYRYFASRGITKIDRLSLQVDVDCCPEEDQAFELNELNFTITGADDTILNSVSMQNDSLLVLGSEVSSFKPEAVMEFDLGYNFMERFTADSTESINLNYGVTGAEGAMSPRFVVSEEISSFSFSHLGILALFIAFWIAVFLAMHLYVKPKDQTLTPAPGKFASS